MLVSAGMVLLGISRILDVRGRDLGDPGTEAPLCVARSLFCIADGAGVCFVSYSLGFSPWAV